MKINLMEKPNPDVYNSTGFYLYDLEKYNQKMKQEIKSETPITVKGFYDYIISQMTPEQALMKLLEGSLIQYEKLKFDSQEKAVHPIHIIALAALDMDWQIAIKQDEENVNGLAVGTDEYMKSIFKHERFVWDYSDIAIKFKHWLPEREFENENAAFTFFFEEVYNRK